MARLQKAVKGLYRISKECFVRGKTIIHPTAIILQHGNMLEMAKSVSQFKTCVRVYVCVCVCARACACCCINGETSS